MPYKFLILCLLILFSVSCDKSVDIPEFNGKRAFAYLSAQVAFGPRVPGSAASSHCRDYFYNHYSDLGFEIDSQVFSIIDPYSRVDTPLVNVIARYRGDKGNSKSVLLMAHYDSRPRADRDRIDSLKNNAIDGANDGASGVAILMEIGNLLTEIAPEVNVDMVLTDGEDWGKEGDIDNYLLGSKYFSKTGIRQKYYFGIVVDMVGDKDQKIYREVYSERFYKPLNDMVWSTAKELGITTFNDTVRYEIHDDHLSVGTAGVPTIVLIDFLYPYWHTTDDRVDKCSAQSLSNVGRVLTSIIYNKKLWPKL